MNVAGYYYVHRASIVLDPSKEVRLSPRSTYCDTRPRHLGHADRALLKHNKELWYYPPIVASLALFESAAHGDIPRDDELNPMPGYKKHLDRIEHQGNEHGEYSNSTSATN